MRAVCMATVGATVLAMGLACAGLGIGPGTTVATVPLVSGQTATVSHSATTGEVGVWLTFDLEYTEINVAGRPVKVAIRQTYEVQGPLEIAVNGTPVLTDALDLTADGGPLAGSSGRMAFGETKTSVAGKGSHSARVWLYSAEALSPGDTVTVTVTPQISPNVTVKTLTVDLTE